MATANDIIEEAIRLTLGNTNEQMNQLAGGVSAGATWLTFSFDLGGIQPGSLLSIDTEIYRVWTVDVAAKAALVAPGFQGTTSAAHTAGTLVYVNPRIPRAAALKALNDELNDLSSPSNGLFQMLSHDFVPTASTSTFTFDVPGYLISPYEVRQQLPGTLDWRSIDDWRYSPAPATSGLFPTGVMIQASLTPSWLSRFYYKASFNPVVLLSQDIAGTGLPTTAFDILPLGIIMRLGATREIQRNFTEAQGSSRRAEEVPAQAVGNSYRGIQALRQSRIQAEYARLIQAYPNRRYP